MLHANTLKVIEDWRRLRGDRPAPLRAALSPTLFGPLLPQVFMLGQGEDGVDRFRLSGGLLSDLHGGDLRGLDLASLFSPRDGAQVLAALKGARRAGEPVIVAAGAHTATGEETRVEILLAPLVGPTGELDRTLGLYQPTSSLNRLLGRRVTCLSFRSAQFAPWPSRAPAPEPNRPILRLVAMDGRRVA